MDKKVYEQFVHSDEAFSYSCNNCTLSEMPFSSSGDTINDPFNVDTPCQVPAGEDQSTPDQCMWDCFKMNGLHFLHLNTRK